MPTTIPYLLILKASRSSSWPWTNSPKHQLEKQRKSRKNRKKYPPALKKLKSIRDQAGNIAKTENAEISAGTQAFLDFAAINRTLKETEKTVELFKWLHGHRPQLAQCVSDSMTRLLIKSGEYKLCGQYIDVDQFYKKLCQTLDRDRNGPPKVTARYLSQRQIQDWRDRAFRTFANDTITLVGILALNGRNEEAGQIAARAIIQWDNPEFGKRLKEAESGVVPQPQP